VNSEGIAIHSMRLHLFTSEISCDDDAAKKKLQTFYSQLESSAILVQCFLCDRNTLEAEVHCLLNVTGAGTFHCGIAID